VARETVQPGVERAVSSEIRQSTIGLDERFLSRVLRLVPIVYETGHQGENLVLIFQHKQVERPLVSLLYPFYQLLVGLFSHGEDPPGHPRPDPTDSFCCDRPAM